MKLIVVTSPTYFVEEDKIITALFEEGLDILHLRKPETLPIYAERLLTLIPQKFHNRIVLHDYFYLKREFKLKGILLNSRNPIAPTNYTGSLGYSCHTLEEVKEKKQLYDYVFLSPIFDSLTKENLEPSFSPELLREAQRERIIDNNVVALGGVCIENLIEVKDFGFGGAAVLGDLWNRFDVCTDRDFKGVIKHFKELKKMAE